MNKKDRQIGPALPPEDSQREMTYGPCLPLENEDKGPDVYGPALPPSKPPNTPVIGPALPAAKSSKPPVIGPVLPFTENVDSDSSEDSYIGPKMWEASSGDPANQESTTASRDFERRAEKMKDKLLNKGPEVKKREEWMTELPSRLGPQIGLGARAFKRQTPSEKDSDRSGWTDTPADKIKKSMMEEDSEAVEGPSTAELAVHKRNVDIMENLGKYNKTERKESLLDMHKKKRKKSKKESKGRREFDRDKDLNIQNVNSAEAKSMVDKARLLNGRFSHGTSHFL